MRRILIVLLATVAAWLGLVAPAAASVDLSTSTVVGHNYASNHHVVGLSNTRSERGPPASYRQRAINDDGRLWSGVAVGLDDTTPGLTTTNNAPIGFAQVRLATGATQEQAQVRDDGPSVVFGRGGVAANGGFDIVEGGLRTRAINFRPKGTDPNWGMTPAHLNKHMFGSSKYSLRTIDPAGNSEIWRGYIQDLASRPVTSTTSNGMLDIIGTFPRTGGGGTFQFGIRLSPASDGSFDLITLLTKQ